MDLFKDELEQRLNSIRRQGLYRGLKTVDSPQAPRIQVSGQWLLNFSSNDYLGLANEPVVKEAAIRAIQTYGAGSGASRLISGSLAPHHELERTLAEFKGTEAALSFSSGYAAALGTICALMEKSDVIIIDRLVHACILDAARLCGAKLRVFTHNDLNELEAILQWADRRRGAGTLSEKSSTVSSTAFKVSQAQPRALIVTESVFSMDGDCAPLPEIVQLKEKYGAWLMVDEAHSTGLYGEQRRGLAEVHGLSERIEVQMGTLGKALGASGGFICGSRSLIDYLINRARTLIFSTAPPPAAVAAATEGIEFVRSPEGEARRNLLWQRVAEVRNQEAMPGIGASFRANDGFCSAIHPFKIGSEDEAMEMAAALHSRGVYVPAIRFPAVARGQARLRLTVTAAHTVSDLTELFAALHKICDSSQMKSPK